MHKIKRCEKGDTVNYERKYELEDTARDIAEMLVEDNITLSEIEYILGSLKDMLSFKMSSYRIKPILPFEHYCPSSKEAHKEVSDT